MKHDDMLKLANDICPECGEDIDTGYECNGCGKDYVQLSGKIEKVRLTISKFTTSPDRDGVNA